MKHLKEVHSAKPQNDNIARRVRPVRIAAKRARELMCIINDNETGAEDAQWLSEGEIEMEEQENTAPMEEKAGPEIITKLDEWLASPWSCVTSK